MAVQHLTEAEFYKKVADLETSPSEWKFLGERPALVDFFATWCGPCKRLSPVFEELADEFAGKVDFYKVDVDQEEPLSDRFGIRSVPTLLFVPLGGQPQLTSGVMSKADLKKAIEDVLM